MNASHETIEAYLNELRGALDMPASRAESVVTEVRADLHAHLERFRGEGLEDDAASRRAIDEMRNAYELAHHMRREVPPLPGNAASVVRLVVALAIGAWGLTLLWYIRGGIYGFDPIFLALITGIHFPAFLLMWPRIVWRRNALHRANIGVIGALLVLLLAGVGTSSSTEMTFPIVPESGNVEAAPLPAPVIPTIDPDAEVRRRRILGFYAVGLSLTMAGLLLSIQRRSQRRIATAGLLLTLTLIEVPYQIEEWNFRRDLVAVQDYVDETRRETGAEPSKEQYAAAMREGQAPELHFRTREGNYHIFWERSLSPGHSLRYSSESENISVQD